MLRLTLLAVSLVAICAMSIDKGLDFVESSDLPYNLEFEFGKRIAGDRLVETFQLNRTFDSPKDLQWQPTYPRRGTNGANVTFVKVLLSQDNKHGLSRLIGEGGIGHRKITVLTLSKEIWILRGTIEIYGQLIQWP